MTEHQLTEIVLRAMRQQLDEKMRLSPQGREGRKQQQGTTDTVSQSLDEIKNTVLKMR